MPIFMDRHEVKGATAEQVAEVHQKDLKIQSKYGCKGMTYWFDEKSGMAFCLIEAPKMQSVIDMHNEAHGLVPNKVIRVDEAAVYTFLGRISDPFRDKNSRIAGIINESGIRTIIHLEEKYPPGYFKALKGKYNFSKSNEINELSTEMINAAGGNKVDEDSLGLAASFTNQNDALNCAENIQSSISKRKIPVKVSIGVSSGWPVSGSKEVFGDTIKTAKNLSCIAQPGKTFISASVNRSSGGSIILRSQHNNVKALIPEEETFLNNLIKYAEKNLDRYGASVDQCCESLGMSKSRLYRKTISLTSFSPSEFLKEFRLKSAMKKIDKREGNIAEIAFASGFNTPSYFTQCFKERFGILPSDYLTRIS